MDEQLPVEEAAPSELVDEELDTGEISAITLIDSVRVIEPLRATPPALVQAAAAAATGFVAGAAAATVLSRRRTRQALLPARGVRQLPVPLRGARQLPTPAPAGTQTFLVHVQALRRS
jgi:hypothetical protein